MRHAIDRRAPNRGATWNRARAAAATAALVAIGIAVSASSASAAVDQVPASIASDCSVDVTSQLLAWIASVPDYSTLSFGTNACYRIDGTLDFSGRTGLEFEGNGSTFRAFGTPTNNGAIWRAWQSTGLTFRDMTITGSYAQGGTFDSSLQHADGFDLRGSNADIANVTIDDVAGDCVYFGLGSDSTTRSSGSFHNSTCTGTSRNAVSVTAGTNILVQDVTTSSIGYDVFDVEPNTGTGDWGAQNVRFDSNAIGSYAQSIYSLVPNAPLSDMSFTNNVVIGGLKITTGTPSAIANRPQRVTITGNVSDTPRAPAAMNLTSIDGLTVTGNIVPMTAGTMAQVDSSCGVNVSTNTYPGGASEATIAPYTCVPTTTTTSSTTTSTTTVTTSPAVPIKKGSAGNKHSGTKTASARANAAKLAFAIGRALRSTSSRMGASERIRASGPRPLRGIAWA